MTSSDNSPVLTVSTLVPASMNLGEVCLSLPSVINREGVARVLPIPLNESEEQAVKASAEILRKHNAMLDELIK